MKGTLWVDDDGNVTRAAMDDPTGQALSEIRNPRTGQRDVAQTLALAMEWGQREAVDWGAVSAAAVARWGPAGWRRIKRQAWSGRCWPQEDIG
jgi:hypothetical protein